MTSNTQTKTNSTAKRWLNWYSDTIGSKFDQLCTCGAISAGHVLHDDDLNTKEWDGGSVFATVHEDTMLDEFFQDHSLVYQNEKQDERKRRLSGVEESKSNHEDENDDDDDDDIVDPDFGSPSSTATAFFPPKMPMYFASTAIGMSSSQHPKTTTTDAQHEHTPPKTPTTPMNDETMRTIASIHRKETMPTENTALGKIERALEQVVKLHPRPRDMNDSSLGLRRIRLATPIVSKPSVDKPLSMDDSQRDPSPATYFDNVPCFTSLATTDDTPQPLPPISPADTYTTVSLSHSFDNSYLVDDEDEEDCIVGMEGNGSTISTQIASNCFREPPCGTPPRTDKNNIKFSSSLPMIPDPSNKEGKGHRFLLRMKPQNYVHGDDHDEDLLYLRPSPEASTGPSLKRHSFLPLFQSESTEEVDVAI